MANPGLNFYDLVVVRVALVVDDDAVMAATVKVILERAGWTVLVRTDGTEALDLFDSLPDRPAVVVTDNQMILMHGIELIRELRHRSQSLAIVMMTGDVGRPAVPENVPVIHKPFRKADLIDAVSQARQSTSGRAHPG